jgi:hypothetical protein
MDDDTALEADLRRAVLLYDPPPATAVRAAEAAFAIRSVDAELAMLTFDSHVAAGAVRTSSARDRLLTFTAGTVSLDIELRYDTKPHIIGRLDHSGEIRVDVRSLDRTVTVTTDELGRFSVRSLGKGPYSLRCHLDPDIVTEWFS